MYRYLVSLIVLLLAIVTYPYARILDHQTFIRVLNTVIFYIWDSYSLFFHTVNYYNDILLSMCLDRSASYLDIAYSLSLIHIVSMVFLSLVVCWIFRSSILIIWRIIPISIKQSCFQRILGFLCAYSVTRILIILFGYDYTNVRLFFSNILAILAVYNSLYASIRVDRRIFSIVLNIFTSFLSCIPTLWFLYPHIKPFLAVDFTFSIYIIYFFFFLASYLYAKGSERICIFLVYRLR